MKKQIVVVLVTVIGGMFLFVAVSKVSAFSFGEMVDGVKSFFLGEGEKKNAAFTIESDITLAPEGDFDKNGEIDSGDIVRFTYKIVNTTEEEYVYGALNTNISRNLINFIHNVHGTPSLNDDSKTVVIPNLSIPPLGESMISFDARIMLFTDKDRDIFTQAEYFNKDKKSLFKSELKQIKVKKVVEEKIESL